MFVFSKHKSVPLSIKPILIRQGVELKLLFNSDHFVDLNCFS